MEVYLCRAVAVGQHILFFTASAMWGKQHGGIFFAGTLGLGLLARIGTADEGKCYAADATMSTVGVMLDGGMQLLGHTPHTFP